MGPRGSRLTQAVEASPARAEADPLDHVLAKRVLEALLDKYAVMRPAMQKAMDRLGDVPVDIEPIFPLAK